MSKQSKVLDSSAYRGMLFMSGTAVFYAVGNVFDQAAMVKADSFIAALVRAAVIVAFSGAVLTFTKERNRLRDLAPRARLKATVIYAGAGICSELLGTVCFYNSVKYGGIAIAVPCTQTWLIWSALAGMVLLREKTSLKTLLGLVVSLCGLVVLVFSQAQGTPYTSLWKSGVVFGLLASLGWASSTVLIRKGQIEGLNPYSGMFVQYVSALVGIGLVVMLSSRGGQITRIPAGTYMCVVGSALTSGVVAVICMYQSLRVSPIERVIPIMAAYPVLATILGVVFLRNYINAGMLGGIALVAAGVAVSQIRFGTKMRERKGENLG